MRNEGTRRCKRCGEVKPLSAFTKDKRIKSGYTARCRECTNLYIFTWYHDGDQEAVERLRLRREGKQAEANNPDTKWCGMCQTLLPRTEFHKNRGASDGLNVTCKKDVLAVQARKREQARTGRTPRPHELAPEGMKWCSAGKHYVQLSGFSKGTATCKFCCKTYCDQHREEIRSRCREYWKANSESLRERSKAYRELNRETLREKAKERRRAKKEVFSERRRRYYAKNKERLAVKNRRHYQTHADVIKARTKAWRKANPEKHRLNMARRYGRERGAPGFCSPEQFRDKTKMFGCRCYLCGTSLEDKVIHLEHRIPLSRGGSNWPANLAPACGKCNSKKHAKTEKEFRALTGLARQCLP